jgi:uncharacterized protein YecT (DUF1311 family)
MKPNCPTALRSLLRTVAAVVCFGVLATVTAAQTPSTAVVELNDFIGLLSTEKSGASLIGADGNAYHTSDDSPAEIAMLSACQPNTQCRISGLAKRDGTLIKVTRAESAAESSAAAGAIKPGPSFDCRQAGTAVERMICGSYELAALDSRLAGAYRAARARGDAHVAPDQVNWVRQRNQCKNEPCLREAYQARLEQLATPGPGPADAR